MKKWIVLGITLILLVSGLLFVNSFKLKEIQIAGCDTVDEQVVRDAIESRRFSGNTLTLFISNKLNPIDGIPFVEKLEIKFESRNKIIVTVYEKSIAGCVEYMNQYIYFDKDGIVLESSSDIIEGVPCIKGLNFERWEMGKKLPIDDKTKFQHILQITQLIDKYELSIDGIKFTGENEIVLYHKDITIEMGDGENLAIQMMNLGSILEELEGLSGTLNMKDFDSDDATASFSKN